MSGVLITRYNLTGNTMSPKEQWLPDESSDMPSWTSLHVSDSEDDASIHWNDNESKLDKVTKIDNTGTLMEKSDASTSSTRPNLSPGQESAVSSAKNQQSNGQPTPGPIQTDQAKEASDAAKPAHDLNASSPSTSSATSTSRIPGEPGPNADPVVSLSATKILGAPALALGSHSEGSGINSTSDKSLSADTSGATLYSGRVQNAGIGAVSTSGFGSGEGSEAGDRVASEGMRGPRRVPESSNDRGSSTKSTLKGTLGASKAASTSKTGKAKKGLQTSLSAYGFLPSSPVASPSKSKPKSKVKAKSTFLGVFIPPTPKSKSAAALVNHSKTPASRSSNKKDVNGHSNLVDALSAAFTSNDHGSYSGASAVAPSSSNSNHSITASSSSRRSNNTLSTKPTSSASTVHIPNDNSTLLAFHTNSSSTSRNSKSTARPASKAKSASAYIHTNATRKSNSNDDNDYDAMDIIGSGSNSKSKSKAQTSLSSLSLSRHVDSSTATTIANGTKKQQIRSSSSTPDPLGIRTPSEGNDDDDAEAAEVEAEIIDVEADADAAIDTSLGIQQERKRGPRKVKLRVQSPAPLARVRGRVENGVEEEEEDTNNDNGHTNSIVDALSHAFANLIGSPAKSGSGPSVRVVRTGGVGTSPSAGTIRIPARTLSRRQHDAEVPETPTRPEAEERGGTGTLADALSRAFANNNATQDRVSPVPARFATRKPQSQVQVQIQGQGQKASRKYRDRDVGETSQEEMVLYLDAMVAEVPTLRELEEMQQRGYGEDDDDEDEENEMKRDEDELTVKEENVENGIGGEKVQVQILDGVVASIPAVQLQSQEQETADAASEIQVEEIETEGVIQAREERARELEERKFRKMMEKEEQRQRKWEEERFLLKMSISHVGGGKWAKLVEAKTELEKLRRGYPSEVGAMLLQGMDVEEVMGFLKTRPSTGTEGPVERELKERKAEAQYTSDGRSNTEQFLQRVNEWFGPEFLNVKTLGTGQKPKKPRVPQIPKLSLRPPSPSEDDESEVANVADRTPPPETAIDAIEDLGSGVPTANVNLDGHHVVGVEKRAELGMKRARTEVENAGISGMQVNGDVDGSEDGRAAKRIRVEENGNSSLATLDVTACPGLLQKLIKGKSKITMEELKMIGQFLDLLGGDDWSQIPEEAFAVLQEARDQLWEAVVHIAGIAPGSETLGIERQLENQFVALAQRLKSKFEGS